MTISTKLLRDALLVLQPVARMGSVDGGGKILISAGDGEMRLACAAIGKFTAYIGERLPAPDLEASGVVRFDYLINALSSAETTELEFTDKKLTVRSGKWVTPIAVADAETFPAIPESEAKAIGVQAQDLIDAINAVHGFEHDKPEAEPVASGLSLRGEPKRLIAEATFRTGLAKFERMIMCPEFEVLVPGKLVELLVESLAKPEATLNANDRFVGVNHATGWLRLPLIEGKMLNTDHLWADKVNWLGHIDREALKAELARAQIYFDASLTPMASLALSQDGVSGKANGSGSEITFSSGGKCQPASFNISCPCMIRCLGQLTDESVEIGVTQDKDVIRALRLRSASKEVDIISSVMR